MSEVSEKGGDNDALFETFWFNREDDEVFIGNLTTRKAESSSKDQDKEDSKGYSEFIATSTRLSLASFAPHVSTKLGASTGAVLAGQQVAKEIFPEVYTPMTWSEYFSSRKITIVTMLFSVGVVLFMVLFTAPVSSVNANQGTCTVFDSTISEVVCPNSDSGICLEHQVTVPSGDGLITSGTLQGFEKFLDVNCAVNNCNQEFDGEANDVCIDSLADDVDINTLSAAEIEACNLIGTTFDCVVLSQDDSPFIKTYFEVEFEESGENIAISLPKQPGVEVVAGATTAILLLFAILIVASVFECKRPRKVKEPKEKDALDKNANPTLNYIEPPTNFVEEREKKQGKMIAQLVV